MSIKYNNWGTSNPEQIIDQIFSFSAIFEKIYGKLLPALVYNQDLEDAVHILSEVYLYKDARQCFPKKIDHDKFKTLSKHVFRFIEPQEWQK